MLGSLADYGGPTKTMLVLAGSPAIDAGVVTTNTSFSASLLPERKGKGYCRLDSSLLFSFLDAILSVQ